jgi:hypothetical protein
VPFQRSVRPLGLRAMQNRTDEQDTLVSTLPGGLFCRIRQVVPFHTCAKACRTRELSV